MRLYDESTANQLEPGPFGVTEREPPPAQPAGESPEQIRADIIQTRMEMTDTINAIQERLDPERLKHQVKTTVRGATIGKAEDLMSRVEYTARDTGNSLWDTIRMNPVPAALVGFGLAWLYRNRVSHAHDRYDRSYSYGGYPSPTGYGTPGYRGYYGTSYGATATPSAGEAAGRVQDSAQRMAGQASSQVREFGDRARDTAQEMGDRVQGQVGQFGDRAQELGSQVQGQVADLSDRVQDRAQVLGDQMQGQFWQTRYDVERTVRENPLAAGAFALAVGAAVGLMVPSTPQENQLMGEAREQVVQKAQSAAQDAMQGAKEVAEQVRPAAEQAVKDQMQSKAQ